MLDELNAFTGPGWEQEDDVTFVTLERMPVEEKHNEEMELWSSSACPASRATSARSWSGYKAVSKLTSQVLV
jgi:hypothetical protein